MSKGEFKDHFSGHAADYARARPGYPASLFEWLSEQCSGHSLAWDCATGSGQAALALTKYFDAVFATDASADQIANAEQHERVQYEVAPAEDSGLPNRSVDIVTVAQAMHWFDLPRFYAEVNRVLKDDGVIAAWGYGLTRVSPEIDAVIDHFDKEIVGPYWPPERKHIDAHYQDLDFPFPELVVPQFEMQREWDRWKFMAYIGTWSSVQRYRRENDDDPLERLQKEIADLWPKDEMRIVTWPIFFRVGRKMPR